MRLDFNARLCYNISVKTSPRSSAINEQLDWYYGIGCRRRSLRIEWTIKNGQYEAEDIYEYITPGIVHRILDFLAYD